LECDSVGAVRSGHGIDRAAVQPCLQRDARGDGLARRIGERHFGGQVAEAGPGDEREDEARLDLEDVGDLRDGRIERAGHRLQRNELAGRRLVA